MISTDNQRWLTVAEIRDRYESELGIKVSKDTIKTRMRGKKSAETWGARAQKDIADGKMKYVISEESWKNIWVKAIPKQQTIKEDVLKRLSA